MAVFIGVDPHKRLHAACAVDDQGRVLARTTVANSTDGFSELRTFARRWRTRTWAIEGCNGVGKHLSQRLVAAGERVVDVSTRRAALVRVYAGGNGRKNDDTDAHSIAMVAVHTPDLPEVVPDARHAALRLLSQRRSELVAGRTQCACRIHRDLVVLLPGGCSKRLTVTAAKALLARVRPRDEVGRLRRRLVADQIRDLAAWDKKIAAINADIAELVADTDTSLRDIHGIGSIEPPWVRWRLLSLESWSHATGEGAGEADDASLLGAGEGAGGSSGAPGPV